MTKEEEKPALKVVLEVGNRTDSGVKGEALPLEKLRPRWGCGKHTCMT